MKHLILFPIPDSDGKLRLAMDGVASITGMNPPYHKLPPHMTFHRPLTKINEEVLRNIVRSVTLQMKQTRITLGGLHAFGKQYIVLTVYATRNAAALWVGINDLLSRLPEYEHGKYDGDNMLHVTVAAKTSAVFDRSWPLIQERIKVEPMVIPLTMIALCRKPVDGGRWELVEKFRIPE